MPGCVRSRSCSTRRTTSPRAPSSTGSGRGGRGDTSRSTSSPAGSPSRRAATRTRSRLLELAGVEDKPGSYLRLAKDTLAITRDHERAESEHFIFLYPKGKDAVLAPYALEALEAQRAALEKDLGHAPPGKVRVEVVNDAAELARVSTLTQKQIDQPAPSPSASSTS